VGAGPATGCAVGAGVASPPPPPQALTSTVALNKKVNKAMRFKDFSVRCFMIYLSRVN
jgi:hypothetical protein